MTTLYMLESGITNGSKATKRFFKKVEVFSATKCGETIRFTDVNSGKTLTTSTAVVEQKSENYAIVNTQHSTIHLWKVENPCYNGDLNLNKMLVKASYKGFEYLIVDRGTHPCCYVNYSGTLLEGKSKVVIPRNVHGGITYTPSMGGLPWEGEWVGWDYNHLNDIYGPNPKAWTTTELIEDCQKAIDELDLIIDQMIDEEIENSFAVDYCLYASPLNCG